MGTGTVMAGQTMAGLFSSQLAQLGAIHALCVFLFLDQIRVIIAVYSFDHAHGNLQV